MADIYEPNLLDPELMADPHGGFKRLREEAPVCRGRTMGGDPAWYVTRAADVRAILNDPRFVVTNVNSAPDAGGDPRIQLVANLGVSEELATYVVDLLPDRDGADHTRLRRLVAPAFGGRRIANLRPRVKEITDSLLDEIEAGGPGPVDLINSFAYPLPITVICELVGVPESDRPAWREWGDALLTLDPARFAGALQSMVDQVKDLLERVRAEPADDLISSLIKTQADDGGYLSDDDLVKLVITLVNTGHETTAHLLSNAVAGLLAHPEQLELLRREPERWPVAVHEMMRLWTPVRVTALRYATEDVEIGGVPISTGEAVQPVLISANTDPGEHSDADRFDIRRREGERGEGHVGFGHGIHYCLGAALARQEAEIALSTLFSRFPDLTLSGEPQWLAGPLMVRMSQLPVKLRG
ncbi:cytochrome P450 [Streptomyces sp. NPDC005962]|uniref:cytochrome P450 family protein n=1 Tax=Streptomyces sp. NPDC005962 TaxID=3154466 RepID=UPI0033E6D4EA